MQIIRDFLKWQQLMLQAIGRGIVVRFYEEPVISTSFFRAIVAMAVGFGLGWSGEQVALTVVSFEAMTAYISRQEVTPNVRLP